MLDLDVHVKRMLVPRTLFVFLEGVQAYVPLVHPYLYSYCLWPVCLSVRAWHGCM